MYITLKNTTKGLAFILHFSSQDSVDRLLKDFHKFALKQPDTGDFSVRKDIERLSDTIKERCTSNYIQVQGELTSMLFSDETTEFLTFIMVWCHLRG